MENFRKDFLNIRLTNDDEVLERVKENRRVLDIIKGKKRTWFRHCMGRDYPRIGKHGGSIV